MLTVGPTLGTAIAIFALYVAFYVQRIDRRTRLAEMRAARLSLTYQKILIDVDAIQTSLVYMSREMTPEADAKLLQTRTLRSKLLRAYLEDGPNTSDLLMGLEPPDPENDPIFWRGDLFKRLGLESNDTETPISPPNQ